MPLIKALVININKNYILIIRLNKIYLPIKRFIKA